MIRATRRLSSGFMVGMMRAGKKSSLALVPGSKAPEKRGRDSCRLHALAPGLGTFLMPIGGTTLRAGHRVIYSRNPLVAASFALKPLHIPSSSLASGRACL